MRPTDEQVARLRELDRAAPPAPWGDFDASGQFQLSYGDYGWYVAGAGVETEDSEQGLAAAELIARARNLLPALLDAVAAERERADKATAVVEPALEVDSAPVHVSDEWIAELGRYKAGAGIELPWAGEVSGE